jgi:hypothetical protein
VERRANPSAPRPQEEEGCQQEEDGGKRKKSKNTKDARDTEGRDRREEGSSRF